MNGPVTIDQFLVIEEEGRRLARLRAPAREVRRFHAAVRRFASAWCVNPRRRITVQDGKQGVALSLEIEDRYDWIPVLSLRAVHAKGEFSLKGPYPERNKVRLSTALRKALDTLHKSWKALPAPSPPATPRSSSSCRSSPTPASTASSRRRSTPAATCDRGEGRRSVEVSFVGLGAMGYPMAGHLARKGHRVTVFNRTRAVAERHAGEFGSRAAQDLGEAASSVGDLHLPADVARGGRGGARAGRADPSGHGAGGLHERRSGGFARHRRAASRAGASTSSTRRSRAGGTAPSRGR